jgi:hypothetical protein
MQDDDPPPAKFRPFEKIVVTDEQGRGHPGTVLWRALVQYRQFASPDGEGPPGRWSQWEYAVALPDLSCCPTFEEDRLESTGEFDAEGAHLGRRFELSFDTGLEDDNVIVEGSYRVPGRFWQIFLFRKGGPDGEPVSELRHCFRMWESGITGVVFDVPVEAVLDRDYILQALAGVFGAVDWAEVRGPDSQLMR